MIPSAEILDDIDFPPLVQTTSVEETLRIFQYLAGKFDDWNDYFFLLKGKCPPTSPPVGINSVTTHCRYLCKPFPLSKIDSVSFERPKMSNLLIAKDGRLIQLLFRTDKNEELKPGYEYIDVIEYHTPLGMFLARKPI